ncbi:hypothetical protein ILUMI_23509 [Ignelater luminosus]|uniref:Reverse transcriptase/retrotransposon-derived protein RNase H-like domain-containing protein n=1 Tax=Ignelater luminosus TaxID=2038154 RepID=A0A8K0CBX6_IGNLU|nr:hypothetical protein ILUMI_23509 [Ignelater luminosus]
MDIVGDDKPVSSAPIRQSLKKGELAEKIVQEWRDLGIVRDTNSSYASPVLLVYVSKSKESQCGELPAAVHHGNTASSSGPSVVFFAGDCVLGFYPLKVTTASVRYDRSNTKHLEFAFVKEGAAVD